MNILKVMQLVGLIVPFINQIEILKKGQSGNVKREAVKALVLQSIASIGMFLNLSAERSKKFDTALNKIIDGVVTLLNMAEETKPKA